MKKIAGIVCLCLALASLARAQIEYIDTTGVNELKATTTIFVIPEGDSALREEYKLAIRKSWKLTTYKIVPVGELSRYADKKGYSFFCEICFGKIPEYDGYSWIPTVEMPLNGNKDIITSKSLLYKTKESQILGFPAQKGDYFYYSLFIKQQNSSGEKEVRRYADIRKGVIFGIEPGDPIAPKNQHLRIAGPGNWLYWSPGLLYWSPGLLSIYLHILSNDLGNAAALPDTAALYPFLSRVDTAAMAGMARDTLYIPNYVTFMNYKERFLSKRHKEHFLSKKHIRSADIAAYYPYPYKMVSSAQLSHLLLYATHTINFLAYRRYFPYMYVCRGKQREERDKFLSHLFPYYSVYKGIAVYNSKKGIIYINYPAENISSSFTKWDMVDIANAVKQGVSAEEEK